MQVSWGKGRQSLRVYRHINFDLIIIMNIMKFRKTDNSELIRIYMTAVCSVYTSESFTKVVVVVVVHGAWGGGTEYYACRNDTCLLLACISISK